jgi:hypothetical protein
MAKKKCTKCGVPKPLGQFGKDACRKDGHKPACKRCEQKWRDANRVQLRARAQAWRDKNRVKLQKIARKRYALSQQQPDFYKKRRATLLRRKHGITLTAYRRLLQQQNGCCAICKRKEWVKVRWNVVASLAVDHCHKRGHIRGLLCRQCNTILGLAHDDVALLKAAIQYLRERRLPPPATLLKSRH